MHIGFIGLGIMDQPLDVQHHFDIATAIEPLASTAFVRFQLWKLRFPETQNIRFQLADLCYVANFEIETVGY